jgi:hypothetical protein
MVGTQTTDVVIPAARQNAERAEIEDAPAPDPAPMMPYRDVRDVRLNQSLSLTALLLTALLVISFGVIIYLATKPAQQVVIERSSEGDRVIAVNGQAVRNGTGVGADKPGAGDKQTLAREWAAKRFAIDPDPRVREKDLEAMFKMMAPRPAKAYSDLLASRGELERESKENWQAIWTPQVVEIDTKDPYQVNVVGTWEITKASKGNGGTGREVKQLIFALHMIRDTDQGRGPRNAQTGFLIDDIRDYKDLPAAVPSSTSALKEAQ